MDVNVVFECHIVVTLEFFKTPIANTLLVNVFVIYKHHFMASLFAKVCDTTVTLLSWELIGQLLCQISSRKKAVAASQYEILAKLTIH